LELSLQYHHWWSVEGIEPHAIKDPVYSRVVDHPHLLARSNHFLRLIKAGFTPPAPKSGYTNLEPTLLTLVTPGRFD